MVANEPWLKSPPTPTSTPSAGRKDDNGKRRWDLLPFAALDEVIAVLMHGAERYGEDNWRSVPNWRRRYFSAMMRHAVAYFAAGEKNDPDTGRHHLAHACCCALFLCELELGHKK